MSPAPSTYGAMDVYPDLASYDLVVVSTSAGKDSQAMLDVVVGAARAAGVAGRVVCAHADMGRVEWPGTPELAAEHARHYGLRLERQARPQGDLLDHARARGMWPSAAARWCTSDHKRAQIHKILTRLVTEVRLADDLERPVRVLSCLGYRREESPARAAKVAFHHDGRASTKTTRWVDEWCPILEWDLAQVWERIARAGTRHHPAYDAGMGRLSCTLCVLAGRASLVRAARLRPALAQEYLRVETEIGHRFRADLSMADIVAAANLMPAAAIV